MIDVTTVVLGPFATQILGDMGADVIKVETPDGDNLPARSGRAAPRAWARYFAKLNRNKRSIVLDLKKPAAREALLRLVDGADVFVHNMRLGAAERLGLDYASLAARNPRLIHASRQRLPQGQLDAGEPGLSTT